MKTLGCYVLLAGIVCTIYFFMFFDSSLPVPGSAILGIPDGRVNNVGLMQNKQNGIIIGMGLCIMGTILMVTGKKSSRTTSVREQKINGETTYTVDVLCVDTQKRFLCPLCNTNIQLTANEHEAKQYQCKICKEIIGFDNLKYSDGNA